MHEKPIINCMFMLKFVTQGLLTGQLHVGNIHHYPKLNLSNTETYLGINITLQILLNLI